MYVLYLCVYILSSEPVEPSFSDQLNYRNRISVTNRHSLQIHNFIFIVINNFHNSRNKILKYLKMLLRYFRMSAS